MRGNGEAVKQAGRAMSSRVHEKQVERAHVPPARGPFSEAVIAAMRGSHSSDAPFTPIDPIADDDFQLALYLCYELHYRGFLGVADEREWDSSVLAIRAGLEHSFEGALRRALPEGEGVDPHEVPGRLRDLAEFPTARIAHMLARDATEEQFREFLIHRSAYHLKEADPHSWAIPRLSGQAKAALVEIQADEYGAGRYQAMHSTLFADVMAQFGLEVTYGRYIDRLPGVTLATVNLMSMFGLHRRLRGAIVGHLAAFELGSPKPNRLYGLAVRRLGHPEAGATRFFDEHVIADSVHDMVAAYDLAGALAIAEPELASEIVFGARALDLVDSAWGDHVLEAWRAGYSSLWKPLDAEL
jgi:hypothetical protein